MLYDLFVPYREVAVRMRTVSLLCIIILCVWSGPVRGKGLGSLLASLVAKVPPREASAIDGSEFVRRISAARGAEREEAMEAQYLSGNLPHFLRQLRPVTLKGRLQGGKGATATIFVMPDYLAVGSDRDFFLTPMNLKTALDVAASYGFILPTRKMVDTIFSQSDVHLEPAPMPAGPEMRSTRYYLTHDLTIKAQRRSVGATLASLISGHKKDVVLSGRLLRNPERIAIYGWHWPWGAPIQPLSTVHGAAYADYSHGIRLVSETVLIDDEPMSVYTVLEDPALAGLLSDEGVLKGVRGLFARRGAR